MASGSSVLISGAAGFVGFHLALQLSQSRANNVFLVDNFERGKRDILFDQLLDRPNVELLSGDLRDATFVSRLPDVDYVYHLASINGTENFYSRPFDVLEAAITPTLALLNRFRSSNIRRFLLSSTSETYASTVEQFNWKVPTEEGIPLSIADIKNPRWSYASAKIACESAVNAAFLQFGMPVTTIRYHNVYGPRMGMQHVIPQFIDRARRGVFELYGADNRRSFIYVDDAVRLTIGTAEHDQAVGEIYHIGTQAEISMLELASLIMEDMQVHGNVVINPAPTGSVGRRLPDTTKVERLLGDNFRVPLAEGLRKTIQYYAENSSI